MPDSAVAHDAAAASRPAIRVLLCDDLQLSEKTVKNYVSNVLGKLGLRRRMQAASGDRFADRSSAIANAFLVQFHRPIIVTDVLPCPGPFVTSHGSHGGGGS